ncbi:MAG TPA: tetratricopeptide repeat protein [Burkholderiaceae bacterium]|nr:tetratricopeptide repeat protein [Burkholderiaceae bacterium]
MTGWLRWLLPNTGAGRPQTPAPSSPPLDAAAALRQGDALVDAGRFEDAQASYRLALAQDVSSVSARVNLAFVLLRSDRSDQAVPLLVEAVALAPDNADAQFMLGAEYVRRNDMTRGSECLERAVQLQPSLGYAYPPLCHASFALGDSARALAVALKGLEVAPDLPELHYYLGNVRMGEGEFELAASSYGQALKLQPRYAGVRANLGQALAALGRVSEARESFRQALADGPQDFTSWSHLGAGFRDLGLLDEALAAYRQTARLEPDRASVFDAIGLIEQRMGKHEASLKSLERAVALSPESAQLHCNLGSAYLALYRNDAAMACVERALAIDADFAPAHAMRALLELDRGAFDAALPAYDRAIALDSENLQIRSHHLFSLNYVDDLPRYMAAARAFGALVSAGAKPLQSWKVASEDRPARLRVGLVSGDLRLHPVGYFIESVASQLASHGVDLVAFPTSHYSDELTTRLKQRLAGWHPILGMTDASAAHLIRDQSVHVLLDLAGHTAHHRLTLFPWRAAPVQASWLGYFASTGVPGIDFLIADDVTVSEDSPPDQFTEQVWRLPHTRLCFTEPAERGAFPLSALPAVDRGFVTLGCYQNFNKINDRVIAAWGEIFRALPTARLFLQSRQSGDPRNREAMGRRLEAVGIDSDRVDFAPPAERSDYLKSYANIDFALDTFPFPGGTTTCEALWMGVPTLTLRGETMLQRQGAGLLICAGLAQWVATDVSDYVRRAVSLAAATEPLAQLRASLRQRVLASPIFDATAFARHFADALFGVWARGRPGAV